MHQYCQMPTRFHMAGYPGTHSTSGVALQIALCAYEAFTLPTVMTLTVSTLHAGWPQHGGYSSADASQRHPCVAECEDGHASYPESDTRRYRGCLNPVQLDMQHDIEQDIFR